MIQFHETLFIPLWMIKLLKFKKQQGFMKALLWLFWPLIAFTSNSDNHPLTITVDTINKLVFTEPSIVIVADQFSKTLITGSHQSTYGIMSNDGHQKKITATLSQDYPSQIALKINLVPQSGFVSSGYMQLQSKTGASLLSSVTPNTNIGNLSILYAIQAPRLTLSNLSPYMATVMFTLQDD